MWHKYPYTTMSDLNMDWVLTVIKEAENTIHNIGNIVDRYIEKTANALRTEIKQGTAESKNYATHAESRMMKAVDELENKMYRVKNDTLAEIRKIREDIRANNTDAANRIKALLEKDRVERMRELAKMTAKLDYEVGSVKAEMRALKMTVRSELADFKELVNTLITEIKTELNENIGEVWNAMDALTINIDSLEEYTNTRFTIEHERTNALFNEFERIIYDGLKQKVDILVYEKAIAELEDAIKNINVNTSTVFNPVKLKETSVNEALQDVYDSIIKPWALTAGEYDALQITALQYDKLQLTATQYDTLGKWYLNIKPALLKHVHRDIKRLREYVDTQISDIIKKHTADIVLINTKIDGVEIKVSDIEKKVYDSTHMNSPFTGKVENIREVVLQLASEVQKINGPTASAYDNLQITAGEYDVKQVTAREYDWDFRNISWR